MEKIAEAHRRDLMEYSRGRKAAEQAIRSGKMASAQCTGASLEVATQRSATGLPVTGGRAVRRPLGHHVGELLIRVGVRLGGTTISPS
jgi:hypothetical protein